MCVLHSACVFVRACLFLYVCVCMCVYKICRMDNNAGAIALGAYRNYTYVIIFYFLLSAFPREIRLLADECYFFL